ncbi:MAG: hypothetical protein K6E54_03840 [Bacteroidaceae bacterium]|nr:hypothetical protein [Bacteroidaceae bacterium]
MDALIALFGNKDYSNESPLKKLMNFFSSQSSDSHLLRNQKEMREAFDCKGVKIAIAIGDDNQDTVTKNWNFFKKERADVCISGFFSGDCRPNFSVVTSMNWDDEDEVNKKKELNIDE